MIFKGIKSSVFALSLTLVACSGRINRNPDGKRYDLSLRLFAGGRYYYTISNEANTVVKVNGKEVKIDKKTELGLIYEFENDSLGNKLKITYDKLRVAYQGNGETKYIDIADTGQDADPTSKLLSGIRGASFVVIIDRTGDLVRIDGSNELLDRIMSSMNTNDANAKKLMRETISGWIGEDFIKSNIQRSFKLFPDTAVRINDVWTKNITPAGATKSQALTTCSLKEVNDDIAEVVMKSDVAEPNGKMTVMGHPVGSNLKGTEDGILYADLKTGLLTKGETSSQMTGTFSVMGVDVPVTVNVKGKIEGKRI